MKKSFWGYLIEGLVIFSSVLLSLYLGNSNKKSSEMTKKNNYLVDLYISLEEDIIQLKRLVNILNSYEETLLLCEQEIKQ
ncbi:MAG: Uncharacterised protein [Flavobacterium sp. SCGC AAA160-P02]|nr:MAG: Uncharacterised protein [Flavobacterium sp. SCGC AAA160-P02]